MRPSELFISPIFASANEVAKVVRGELSFEKVERSRIVSTSNARANFKQTIAEAGDGTATLFDRYGRGKAAVVDETAVTYLAAVGNKAFAQAMNGDDKVAAVRALKKLMDKGGELGERIADTLWKDVRPKVMKEYKASLQ